MDLKFIVSGIQLENGVESTSLLLGRTFFRAGAEVVIDKDYLSTIHGRDTGTAYYQIRISDKKLWCSGDEICDALLALQLGRKKGQLPLAATNYLDKIKPGGILIYDSTFVEGAEPEVFTAIGVPAYQIVKKLFSQEKEGALNLIRNSVLVGALFELFGFDNGGEFVRETYVKQFSSKKEVLEKNLKAYEEGRNYIRERPFMPYQGCITFEKSQRKRLLLTGNEAMSISAINSGLSLYTGYPITPASPILEFMEKNLRNFGGVSLQCEDEISAAMAVLGASYGGANAFDATSGPGYSLKVETIGHSGMAEIGLGIVNVQRSGPSTGMPTKTEQSDLLFAIFGNHGEIPKIILAPGDVKEYFEIMPRFSYLRRKYQLPITVLTALDIAEGWSTVDEFDLNYGDKFNSDWKPQNKIGSSTLHERYADTEAGISPEAIPGEKDKIFKMGGAEHDVYGFVTTKPAWRKKIMDKRLRKMQTFLKEDFWEPNMSGRDKSKILLMGWGSTKGAMLEARERLEEKGLSAAVCHFIDMWPIKDGLVRNIFSSYDNIYIVEGNATGQLATVLKMKAAEDGIPFPKPRISSVLCYEGRPIEPRTIVNSVIKEG